MSQPETTLDFEASLEQLEQLVSKMEKGQLSLDQSLEAFEEGVKLTRTCQDKLKNAEQRVTKLTLDNEKISFGEFEQNA